jgi:hypothetical protein
MHMPHLPLTNRTHSPSMPTHEPTHEIKALLRALTSLLLPLLYHLPALVHGVENHLLSHQLNINLDNPLIPLKGTAGGALFCALLFLANKLTPFLSITFGELSSLYRPDLFQQE